MGTSSKCALQAVHRVERGTGWLLRTAVFFDMRHVVAPGPSLHWDKGNQRRAPPPAPPPRSSYNRLLFDNGEVLAAAFLPCSTGTWETPFLRSSAASLSLGNQQKTMPTLLDFPWTSQISPRHDCTEGAHSARQAAGHAVIKKHHPQIL